MPGIPQLSAAKVSNPKFGEKVRNSPDISKGIFHLGICKFESSQVSQPVTQLEIVGQRNPISARQLRLFVSWLSVSILPICTTWERNRR
jgi:hypothetical protein